ncbi:MAG TPA: hypothetical protein VEL11_01885 [Candidatus Bathyarchaeia archaeon]|nr:hypothetical protein [Candidatus Bathyarchaeia archaeon]
MTRPRIMIIDAAYSIFYMIVSHTESKHITLVAMIEAILPFASGQDSLSVNLLGIDCYALATPTATTFTYIKRYGNRTEM